ncbi:hypothetical protein MK489_12610 [Myxococcota bacterium]|nr:hypothetical protein [Myxococcota bacterium]
MLEFEIGKWTIAVDPDLTREIYAGLETSGAESCGCEPCFNFAAVRHLVYTPEILNLFDWLGVDPLLESGVRHLGRVTPGSHRYAGWFHVVGKIAKGPATPVAAADRGRESVVSLVDSGDGLEVGFSTERSLAPEDFRGLPVVTLEFSALAPWISNAPEPD